MDFFNGVSGVSDPIGILGAQKALGLDIGEAFQDAKSTFGEMRKAGAILNANPIGAIVNDLVFPKPMADGTLEAAIKSGGYGRN